MGSRGHWNTNPDVYQFASPWEAATCGGNSTAVGQLHTNISWEWEVKMNSVLNTGLPGIKDKDSEMSICLWLWRTWNNYTMRTWIYNYSQIRGVKMQLATSLTPIDAPGSPGRTKFIPLRFPQIFFFSFSCVWSVFSSSDTASVSSPPTLTDSLAKLNLFLLSLSCNCL